MLGSVEKESLVLWVRNFKEECKSIQDLTNGIILSELMHDISAISIDLSKLQRGQNIDESWALKALNLNLLVRCIESFYRDQLNQGCDIVSGLDVNLIAKEGQPDEIAKLLEYILGCAVQCEDKSTYIHPIMDMAEDLQQSMMHMIENIMHRFSPLSPLASRKSEGFSALSPIKPTIPVIDATAISSLSAQNDQHLAMISSLESRIQEVTTCNNELQLELKDQKNLVDQTHQRLEDLQKKNNLHFEHIQLLEHQLHLKKTETESLEKRLNEKLMLHENKSMKQDDELDIMRSKLAQMSKLEIQMDKYKKKLEESAALRTTLVETEKQNEAYLEKILDLESTVKTITTLKAALEKYKDQVVELETINIETKSDNGLKSQKIAALQEDLDSAIHGKEFIEEQLDALRNENEQLREQLHLSSDASLLNSATLEHDSVASLREKIHRLQRENEQLKASGVADATSSPMISMLQHENDSLIKIKDSLQVSCLVLKQENETLKSRIQQIQQANDTMLTKMSKVNASTQSAASSLKSDGKLREEIEDLKTEVLKYRAKLDLKMLEEASSPNVSIQSLMEKMKEKESVIISLQSDKEKLENYTKKTLQAVQAKYMVSVSSHRNQIQEKDEKIELLTSMFKEMKQQFQREQALMMSAFHEIGCEVQQRSMRAISNKEVTKKNSWIGKQRELEMGLSESTD